MWLVIAFLSVLCFVLLYLLNSQFNKRTKLLEDYSELKAYHKLAEGDVAKHPEVKEDLQPGRKPLSIESIRNALRFNGFSPEVPDTHEPGVIYFKVDDISCRVVADRLPFISLEAGFKLDVPQEDLALLHRAAGEVTQNLFIGKAYVVGDGDGVVFSAEFIGDSYMYFRDNLKQLLTILQEANKRFFQTLESLREKRQEDREAIFSGNCLVQDSPANHKIQS